MRLRTQSDLLTLHEMTIKSLKTKSVEKVDIPIILSLVANSVGSKKLRNLVEAEVLKSLIVLIQKGYLAGYPMDVARTFSDVVDTSYQQNGESGRDGYPVLVSPFFEVTKIREDKQQSAYAQATTDFENKSEKDILSVITPKDSSDFQYVLEFMYIFNAEEIAKALKQTNKGD